LRERLVIILLAVVIGGALGGAAVVYVSRRSAADSRIIQGQSLSYWIRCLDSDVEELRLKAVAVLPLYGEDAVPQLIEKLANPQTQNGAIEALAKIGQPTVNPLVGALQSSEETKRVGAIRALDRLGPDIARPATTPVAKLLDDDTTGSLAAEFLGHVGPNSEAIAAALEVLGHGTATRQLPALRVLARASGSDARVEPALRKYIADADLHVRTAAFEALANLSPPSVDAAPLFIDGLSKSEFHASARIGLVRLASSAIPALHKCTTRPAADVRMQAVELLSRHVGADPRAQVALIDFVNDPDGAVAGRAAASLVSLREKDLPFVKKNLSSPQPKVRLWALNEVRKVQPPLIDDIAPLLDDADESVRNEAFEAVRGVWQVDDPSILYAPQAKDVQERIKGIRLLPFFKDLKKYDMMIAAMEDPNPDVRLAACRALGRSLTSGRAVQRLVEAMKNDQSPAVRADAAMSLRAARSTGNVETALKAATNDPDPAVSAAAEQSLQRRDIDR
jgi:HEAT repeat protein